MQPVSLTLGAVAAALLVKVVEAVGEQVGDESVGLRRRFAEWLRRRVAGHAASSAAVERVEAAPDSPSRVHALGVALDRLAQDDAAFERELRAHVEPACAGGVDVRPIAQTVIGDRNVTLADVQGVVNVDYVCDRT